MEQINQSLKQRLQTVKKPLRKDAVVARGIVLQLEPSWYEEHTDKAERQHSYETMLDWACETFGEQNIISFSVHVDETNPHMHLLFTPVTEDGRLSQKDFIDKGKLKVQHRSLREHMILNGYDVDLKNRKPGKFARRMSIEEYKDFAELQNEQMVLDSAFRANVKKQAILKKKEEDLASKEEQLEKQEMKLKEDISKFTLNAEQCRELLEDIERSNQEKKDLMTEYLKKLKYKDGESMYEKYLQYAKSAQEQRQKELAKRRETLRHFEEIAQAYDNRYADTQSQYS